MGAVSGLMARSGLKELGSKIGRQEPESSSFSDSVVAESLNLSQSRESLGAKSVATMSHLGFADEEIDGGGVVWRSLVRK
ncbi:hypothetical protein ACFX1Q_003258 [Malus domestica]